MSPTPTGLFHEVPIEDLFFSTTDAKGVIDEANEVFARNARYARSELLGAPHNIIRHPDMPGAVFKATWDLLGSGHPVCAYVKNLAKDGSTYWAFATIVPIEGRFLSVRATPCDRTARDLFESLYGAVRAAELAARDSGASARQAAEIGGDSLAQALADNGFASYIDLQLDLVPVEVAARESVCPPLPDLADGSKTARKMLSQVADARSRLGAFATDIAGSLVLADTLARDLRRLRTALASLDTEVTATSTAVEREPFGADVVAFVPVIRTQLQSLSETVSAAAQDLTPVVRTRKQLALSSAIARMQAEAIGRYVVAVETGAEDPRVSERALSSLTTALLAILDADLQADKAATAAYVARVARVSAQVSGTSAATASWRALLDGSDGGSADPAEDSPSLHDTLRTFDVALSAVGEQMRRVEQAVEAVAATNAALDRDELAAVLTRIVELAAKI